jgi:divalent metal cation (Fe/Co/Zn/Cd) transporter
LLLTGFSVGAWSYDKMYNVLTTQFKHGLRSGFISGGHVATAMTEVSSNLSLKVPSPPALIFAAISIASKEWLFRITRRVGQAMNSQILVANAWHHRSDAFSSVLSLISIALAMANPKLLAIDPAAGESML